MPFACEKASGHRGISASRSIEHFRNWLWLLGDDELLEFSGGDNNYINCGAPILKAIADKYRFDWPDDDGLNRMARGEPCVDGCVEGCGG